MPRQHQDSLLDAARQGVVWVLLTPSCNVPFGAADVCKRRLSTVWQILIFLRG